MRYTLLLYYPERSAEDRAVTTAMTAIKDPRLGQPGQPSRPGSAGLTVMPLAVTRTSWPRAARAPAGRVPVGHLPAEFVSRAVRCRHDQDGDTPLAAEHGGLPDPEAGDQVERDRAARCPAFARPRSAGTRSADSGSGPRCLSCLLPSLCR